MAEQPVMEFTDWNESIYMYISIDNNGCKKISKILVGFNNMKQKTSKFQNLIKSGLNFWWLRE